MDIPAGILIRLLGSFLSSPDLFFAPDPFVTQWQDRFTVFFKGYFFLGFAYRTTEDDVHSNTDINFQSMNKSCPG